MVGFPINQTRSVCVRVRLCVYNFMLRRRSSSRPSVRPDHLRARAMSSGRGFRCYFTVYTIKTHGTPPAHGRRAHGPWQHRRATTPGRARAAAVAVQAGTVMFCFILFLNFFVPIRIHCVYTCIYLYAYMCVLYYAAV